MLQEAREAGAAYDEENRGIHGNIRLRHILWFPYGPSQWGHGVLKCSGFGAATFHKEHTTKLLHLMHARFVMTGTRTYSAPEIDVTKPTISRSDDNWSLGCLYLDFITWVLYGSAGVEESRTARKVETLNLTGGRLSIDAFWNPNIVHPIRPAKDKKRRVEPEVLVGDLKQSVVHVSYLQHRAYIPCRPPCLPRWPLRRKQS